MTVENSKRLYDHYVKTNQMDRAEMLLKKYPEFEIKEVEEVQEKPKKKKVVKKE